MNADETWQKACEIIGTRDGRMLTGDGVYVACCPWRGEPAAAMKMLVHFTRTADRILREEFFQELATLRLKDERELADALAAAVIAAKGEA